MKLGVLGQNQHARFKTAVAAQNGDVEWVRLFFGAVPASSMGLVSTMATAGWKVYFSFRPIDTWENIAAGTEDARWDAIGAMLAAIPNAGIWCFNHEGENDRTPKGVASDGLAFRNAFDHIYSRIKPLAPAWQSSAALMQFTFPRGGSGWDPNDWYPSTSEILGLDYYVFRGASDTGAHWATNDTINDSQLDLQEVLDYMDGWGVQTLCFPEFAFCVKDPALSPTDETQRTTFITDMAAQWGSNTRFLSCMYFEVNDTDGVGVLISPGLWAKANYSITDATHPPTSTATVAAFAMLDGALTGGATWDSASVVWDDPTVAWDGGTAVPVAIPAFQGSAFQTDAFQASTFVAAQIAHTLPSLTQAATVHVATHVARITSVLPALQQAVAGVLEHDLLVAQTLPSLTQTLEAALQVTAKIAGESLGGAFQVDTVQADAFQAAEGEGQLLPAFTQHAAGGVLAAGGMFADGVSVLPSLAQAVAGILEVSNEIAQTLPRLVQTMAAEIPQTSGIASVLPALTQQAAGTASLPVQASIAQTLPSLDSSAAAYVTRALWDEWLVTTGDEWLVKT